jgi:AcrR family transcriptional regulator
MGSSTKQKILDASIHLFNENGLANVRLQQIADLTGISVGNLAYHFKNKDAIVSYVYVSVFEEFSTILSQYLVYPNLIDIDNQLTNYFAFFTKYQFYLVDLFEIERSFPTISKQWQNLVSKMHFQIRKRIDFFCQKEIFSPEPHEGIYEILTNNVWMSIVFWIPQQILKGQTISELKFKEAVWSQMLPYLSPKGLEEYFSLIDPILKGSNN